MPKAQIIEPCERMTRTEYKAWRERQPHGRFERIDGVVVAITPERVEHNDRKMQAWLALRRAVRDAGVPCHVNGDGMTVEIGDSDYEPDAILYCGDRLAPGSIAVPNPWWSSKCCLRLQAPRIGHGRCANTFGSRRSAIT
jgi:Uma2 family endonuclease